VNAVRVVWQQSAAIRELLDSLPHDHPAGAITVVMGTEVPHLGVYGYADVANRRAADRDTALYLASVAKPLTAALAILLEADGLLTLDGRRAFAVEPN
jgi:CubicO group peptidase (beta-lactamase class C family)